MKKIHMCDDNPALKGLFQKILEDMGYSVNVAGSGSDTLKALEEEIPDLVLLDIMMEPMDGWEVLHRIRENELTKDVPVIFFTGKMPLPDDIINSEGMLNGFAMKPLRRKVFEEIVSGYFTEKKDIADFCQMALDSGADEKDVCEYAALRNNVRVLAEMFNCLEKAIMSNPKHGYGINGDTEKLRGLMESREKHLHELEEILK